MGSFSIWHWLIVLVVVVLIFGTKKLKNVGSDLGSAVKGFKDGVPPTYACHCPDCQTWSGSAFSQQTYLPEVALSVTGRWRSMNSPARAEETPRKACAASATRESSTRTARGLASWWCAPRHWIEAMNSTSSPTPG